MSFSCRVDSSLPLHQELTKDKLPKHSSKELHEKLEKLAAHEVQPDAAWQAALVQTVAKATKAPQQFLRVLQLYPTQQCPRRDTFCLTDPVLYQSHLEPVDAARIFQRSVLQERIIPAVNEGQPGAQRVLELARELVGVSSGKPEELDPFFSGALDELCNMSHYLLALGSDDPTELGTCSDHVQSVIDSREGTPKNLLKQAVATSPFWRQKEISYRNFDVATQTLLPKLQVLQAKLVARDRTCVKESLALLPKFLDQLRPGTASAFKDELQKTVQDWLASPRGASSSHEAAKGDLEALKEVLSSATLTLPPSLRPCYQEAYDECVAAIREIGRKKSVLEAKTVIAVFGTEDLWHLKA